MSEKQDIVSSEQLIREISKSELYPQLILQIQKDLNRAGIDYEIDLSATPKELFIEIEGLILKKLNTAFNEFLNLLYAVDVSERDMKKCNSEESSVIAQYATYLILKREWQKIYFRNAL